MGFRVNIYVESSRKGPSKGPGAYCYIVEYLLKDGSPLTLEGMERFDSTYENVLALKGIIAAVKRLKKPCCIRVFTPCEHVWVTTNNAWHVQWQKNGWMKSNGKYPNNLELWQELVEVMLPHAATYTKEDHSYRKLMQDKLKRLMSSS